MVLTRSQVVTPVQFRHTESDLFLGSFFFALLTVGDDICQTYRIDLHTVNISLFFQWPFMATVKSVYDQHLSYNQTITNLIEH